MSELRYRRPDEATAVKADNPQRQDSPYQQARHTERQADTRPTRDYSDGYDADADFKRPVPKPLGDRTKDNEGYESSRDALRERNNGCTEFARNASSSNSEFTGRRNLEENLPREVPESDRADTIRAVVDRPDFYDPTDDSIPDRYGNPLTRPDCTCTPCFEGPPSREQTHQGWAGDCGIITALGAVAAYSPEEIIRRIRPQEDGSYLVTLSETRESGGITEPTGRDIELTITPELPVYDDDPGTPACAKAEGNTSWCAIFEKAFAGIDQTWTTERQSAWDSDWSDVCADDQANNVENPRSGPAPSGYARLHQGTTHWERAEALTQLTGQDAAVRAFPAGQDEWRINRVIRDQLNDGKPVLVCSRPREYKNEYMPHRLEAEHVYEVTGVEQGKIVLRNPWNHRHPAPMETRDFARNMNRYYSTLT